MTHKNVPKAKQKNTNFSFDNVNGQFDFSNVILKSVDDEDYYQRKWLIFEIFYFRPMFDPDYYIYFLRWMTQILYEWNHLLPPTGQKFFFHFVSFHFVRAAKVTNRNVRINWILWMNKCFSAFYCE